MKNYSKSRTRDNNSNFNSEVPVYEYSDTEGRNHQSVVMTSGMHRSNHSMTPGISNLCNKSQIKSVKVYQFENDEPDAKKCIKTTRKSRKISSKIFKKFLKDYQDKVTDLLNV